MAKCTDNERAYLDSIFTDEVLSNELEEKVLADRVSKKLRTDYLNAFLKWRLAETELNAAKSAIYSVCSDRRANNILRSIELSHES